MIYCMFVMARFSTPAKRNSALQQVTNYLAQPAIASDLFVPAQTAPYDAAYKGWPNAMVAECRFNTQATRDNLWDQLDAYLAQPSARPDGSYGERWDQNLNATDPDADTNRYNFDSKTW